MATMTSSRSMVLMLPTGFAGICQSTAQVILHCLFCPPGRSPDYSYPPPFQHPYRAGANPSGQQHSDSLSGQYRSEVGPAPASSG